MVACNVGVTKTPLGSTLVVTEMSGAALLPTTLVAALVSLVLTSQLSLIHSQRRRFAPFAEPAATRSTRLGRSSCPDAPVGGTAPSEGPAMTSRHRSRTATTSRSQPSARALRGFLAFSEQRGAGGRSHPRPPPAPAGHPGPRRRRPVDHRHRRHAPGEAPLGHRAGGPGRGQGPGRAGRTTDPGDARRAVLALTGDGRGQARRPLPPCTVRAPPLPRPADDILGRARLTRLRRWPSRWCRGRRRPWP